MTTVQIFIVRFNSVTNLFRKALIANTTYKGGIGNELEFTPNEEQLKFINLFLQFLINIDGNEDKIFNCLEY